MIYGNLVERNIPGASRSVIDEPEASPNGKNVILPVGRETPGRDGWVKSEHVVLTADEAREYANRILGLIGS